MSKDLFLMMREEEVATSNFLPTKIELQKHSKEFAEKLLDEGNINLQETYAQALRLKEALTNIESVLKEALGEENFVAFGLTATYANGGDKMVLTDDAVYRRLKADLDARVGLLKLRQKQILHDEDGLVLDVPKVSTKPIKSSLRVSF